MVLGIDNRTENWKTAYEFAPFFRDAEARTRLIGRLDETDYAEAADIHLELFWKGTRDYLHLNRKRADMERAESALLENCKASFSRLRSEVAGFDGFRDLRPHNYDVSSRDESARATLRRNLYNTEIDIVIETPENLFIGEAKHEMSFGTNAGYVLVHQLIRQYVMAKVLVETLDPDKQIIPFVVGNNVDGIRNTNQVQFMIDQGWMKERNVLDWKEVIAARRCSAG